MLEDNVQIQKKQVERFKKDILLCIKGIDNSLEAGEEISWEHVAQYLDTIAANARDNLTQGIAANDYFLSYTTPADGFKFSKSNGHDLK